MLLFYQTIIESMVTFSITVWVSSAAAQEKKQLDRTAHTASKITGTELPSPSEIHVTRMQSAAMKILQDSSHSQPPVLSAPLREKSHLTPQPLVQGQHLSKCCPHTKCITTHQLNPAFFAPSTSSEFHLLLVLFCGLFLWVFVMCDG